MYAWESALQHPWGLGWGGAGWPHSDFLQVAANLGLLAGLLFVGAYLSVLWRLWRRQRQSTLDAQQRRLGATLLLAFVGVGSLLAFQGVQVLPQFALPTWFAWSLVEVWLRQTRVAPRERSVGQ